MSVAPRPGSRAEAIENAANRIRDCLNALRDHAVFSAPSIARWISSGRGNRRKALLYVLACDAARVFNAEAIRRCGVSATSVKKWRADIAEWRAADAEADAALKAAFAEADIFGTRLKRKRR